MHRWILVSFAAALVCWATALGGCKGSSVGGEQKTDLDADPIALLPPSAVVVATVDARAIFDNAALGPQVSALASRLVPLGDEAGFQPSRDVDRLAVAVYPAGVADVAAVLSGRFDVSRISAATRTTTGAEIGHTPYGGRVMNTVTAPGGATAYCVLSAKTVVSGTPTGVQRVLDRIAAGDLSRAWPPWVAQTLGTPGAEIAVAADFATQPIASAAIGSLSLPWLQGMRVARMIGNFEAPGMNFASTLTYGDAQQAEAAAAGVRSVDGWLTVLGPLLGGIRLQNLEVTTDTADVRCKFAVDDHGLLAALSLATRLLPRAQ